MAAQRRPGIVAFVVVGLALALAAHAPPAAASHYRLQEVAFVTKVERRALARAGVLDTGMLLDWSAAAKKRRWLARETGIAYERLSALASRCDLLRVEGVGPNILDVLVKAGIDDVRTLARADAEDLLVALRKAARGTAMQNRMPARDTVAAWISDARLLRPLLE